MKGDGKNTPFSTEGVGKTMDLWPYSVNTTSGDMAMFSVSGGSTDNFIKKYGSSSTDVTGVARVNPGVTVCGTGQFSGRTCGMVYRVGVKDNGVPGLLEVAFGTSQPGDSGGPWYYGSWAVGLLRGSKPPAHPVVDPTGAGRIDLKHVLVEPVGALGTGMGAYILCSPTKSKRACSTYFVNGVPV